MPAGKKTYQNTVHRVDEVLLRLYRKASVVFEFMGKDCGLPDME